MSRFEQQVDTWGWPAAAVFGEPEQGAFVLVCEHASHFIPPNADDLGLCDAAKLSHAAWDIGALDLAKRLSARLQSPLVAGEISRLVYDCNRPLEAVDCCPARSEIYDVPGNQDMPDTCRQDRFEQIHNPFHAAVSRVLKAAGPEAILVTIHSFTPIYNGTPRHVELGYLSHTDNRFAQACLAQENKRGRMKAALDEPYSATDGVTYSLQKHGESQRLLNVMIEVRNDLIDTAQKAQSVADHLAATLIAAKKEVQP